MSGKYDSELAEALHGLSLDGTCETFGDVEAPVGHVSIVLDYCAPDGDATDFAADGDYIVREDSAGFVTIEGPFEHVDIDADGYYCPVERRADELRAEWDTWYVVECSEPGCCNEVDEEYGGTCEECRTAAQNAAAADRRRYSPTFADEIRQAETMGSAFGPTE